MGEPINEQKFPRTKYGGSAPATGILNSVRMAIFRESVRCSDGITSGGGAAKIPNPNPGLGLKAYPWAYLLQLLQTTLEEFDLLGEFSQLGLVGLYHVGGSLGEELGII